MKFYLVKKALWVSLVLILASFFFFTVDTEKGVAVLAGVLLSSIFMLAGSWILDKFKEVESARFIKIYFYTSAALFILILVLFGILFGLTKINEIYFTVSFIISYLCNSVTKMIFINKIL